MRSLLQILFIAGVFCFVATIARGASKIVIAIRYIPVAGSKKTANCSYLERWDDKVNHIRYAREKSAALCYGMSLYRPDLTPAVVAFCRGVE